MLFEYTSKIMYKSVIFLIEFVKAWDFSPYVLRIFKSNNHIIIY